MGLPATIMGQIGVIPPSEAMRQGMFFGGMGFAAIDGETYVTLRLHPEVAFGKFGIGLNVNLLFNTETGKIRPEDWDETYDYFRLIRYIRYGFKGDRFYTRVGILDAARLGHGFIMNYYTNEASYDARKIGLELDMDFGKFGFETVVSNLGRLEIIGGRGYYRPLKGVVTLPIIQNLTFGGTFVRDVDPDQNRNTSDGVSVWGVDTELPLVQARILWLGLYADFAKIVGHGHGTATGVGLQLKNLGGLVTLHARLERRFLGKEFLASYFDPFYEVDRFLPVAQGIGIRKEDLLETKTEPTKGTFGELYAKVLNLIDVVGTFQRLDDHPRSGILHIAAVAPKAGPGLAFHAAYDKKDIETLKDIGTLDNRSVARLGIGYKIRPYLILYFDYIWSFVLDEETNQYKPQERIEPHIAFQYNFAL